MCTTALLRTLKEVDEHAEFCNGENLISAAKWHRKRKKMTAKQWPGFLYSVQYIFIVLLQFLSSFFAIFGQPKWRKVDFAARWRQTANNVTNSR
jgi:hypothetical protein